MSGLETIGLLVFCGIIIGFLAKAARHSGLEEVTLLHLRFKSNEKPPNQLNK